MTDAIRFFNSPSSGVNEVCCSVLQCVAVCCRVLNASYTANMTDTIRIIIIPIFLSSGVNEMCCSVLQCVAVHCSALQCVAVRCSALQCVAVC